MRAAACSMLRSFALATAILAGNVARAAPEAPDQIRARLASAGDVERHKSDTVVVLDSTDVTVRPDGIGVFTTQRVVKALRDAGVRHESIQRFNFDPATNRLRIVAVRVHEADGGVRELPAGDVKLQPDDSSVIYWGNQQFVAAIPDLQVGESVETIVERTGFNVAYLGQDATGGATVLEAGAADLTPPVPGHWHDEVAFWSSVPVLLKRYVVRVPRDKPLQFEVYNGELRSSVTLQGDQIVYAFERESIAPFQSEPRMAPAGDVMPKLLLATLPDWESKSRWLYGANEPQLASNDEIAAKVRELTTGLTTDEQKIYALNRWVADAIRYVGTSRGSCEGYTVHSSAETFRDRGGVCKDKAGMLATMLRVAGYESYVAMTLARQEVFPIPADQFNHCVTVLRRSDGSFELLDPTWMPRSRDNWSTFEPEQHVVYGTPEGHGLLRSPYIEPAANEIVWRAESRLLPDGQLRGTVSLRAVGGPETLLRRALAGHDPASRDRELDQALARVDPAVRLIQFSTTEPQDYSGPFEAACDYFVPRHALGSGPRRYLRLPDLRPLLSEVALSDLAGTTGPSERKYPLMLRTTRLARMEGTLALPPGWKVETAPESVSIDGDAASIAFTCEAGDGELRYACTLTVKTHRVQPEDYPDYKKVIDAFDKLDEAIVVCRAESASASR